MRHGGKLLGTRAEKGAVHKLHKLQTQLFKAKLFAGADPTSEAVRQRSEVGPLDAEATVRKHLDAVDMSVLFFQVGALKLSLYPSKPPFLPRYQYY